MLPLGLAAGALCGGEYMLRRSARPFLSDAPEQAWAIVPGCYVFPDGTLCHMLEDRVRTALGLYRSGRVQQLLLSGDRSPGYDEVAAMRRFAEEHGVPGERLREDGQGFSTRATMRNAAGLGIRAALVVTQAYHLERAVFLARRFGIEAWGVPADRRGYQDMTRNRMREYLARVKDFWMPG